MWADECECYRIDSFGFCETPCKNDGVLEHRILKVKDWIPHWKEMGVRAVLFSPLMESDTNGYDTKDHRKLDVRLGTNADWKEVCDELHKNDIRVVLEGEFQYVGRGFGPFHDLLSYRECSPYVKWFHTIDFYGNSVYEDCLWYEGRNGNYDLVKNVGSKTYSFTKKGLKKGKMYKSYVEAYKNVNGQKVVIAKSLPVHSITGNYNKSYTNPKSVATGKTKVTVKIGKTYKIKGNKITKYKKSRKVLKHENNAYRFESSNTKVATVSAKGVIKGKSKGTCKVHVIANNGVEKIIKVTVK